MMSWLLGLMGGWVGRNGISDAGGRLFPFLGRKITFDGGYWGMMQLTIPQVFRGGSNGLQNRILHPQKPPEVKGISSGGVL